MKTVACIVCDSYIPNWDYQNDVVHPLAGLSFISYGNYGSAVFDPMWENQHLEIVICDKCLVAKVHHVHGNGVEQVIESSKDESLS
jgi:hypothetical protein